MKAVDVKAPKLRKFPYQDGKGRAAEDFRDLYEY